MFPASSAGFLHPLEVLAAEPQREPVAVVAAPTQDGDFLTRTRGAELTTFDGHALQPAEIDEVTETASEQRNTGRHA